jgi:hypothetical protein
LPGRVSPWQSAAALADASGKPPLTPIGANVPAVPKARAGVPPPWAGGGWGRGEARRGVAAGYRPGRTRRIPTGRRRLWPARPAQGGRAGLRLRPLLAAGGPAGLRSILALRAANLEALPGYHEAGRGFPPSWEVDDRSRCRGESQRPRPRARTRGRRVDGLGARAHPPHRTVQLIRHSLQCCR